MFHDGEFADLHIHSTLYKGGEVHVLGYCFDWRSPGFQKEMQKIIRARIDRGRRMVEKLMLWVSPLLGRK